MAENSALAVRGNQLYDEMINSLEILQTGNCGSHLPLVVVKNCTKPLKLRFLDSTIMFLARVS